MADRASQNWPRRTPSCVVVYCCKDIALKYLLSMIMLKKLLAFIVWREGNRCFLFPFDKIIVCRKGANSCIQCKAHWLWGQMRWATFEAAYPSNHLTNSACRRRPTTILNITSLSFEVTWHLAPGHLAPSSFDCSSSFGAWVSI